MLKWSTNNRNNIGSMTYIVLNRERHLSEHDKYNYTNDYHIISFIKITTGIYWIFLKTRNEIIYLVYLL